MMAGMLVFWCSRSMLLTCLRGASHFRVWFRSCVAELRDLHNAVVSSSKYIDTSTQCGCFDHLTTAHKSTLNLLSINCTTYGQMPDPAAHMHGPRSLIEPAAAQDHCSLWPSLSRFCHLRLAFHIPPDVKCGLNRGQPDRDCLSPHAPQADSPPQ